MLNQNFKRTNVDHCVYVRKFDEYNFIIFLLYVHDMLVSGQYSKLINKLKSELSNSFDMKDLGLAKNILGMQITRNMKCGKLWLS
jgi:hypothetical protein